MPRTMERLKIKVTSDKPSKLGWAHCLVAMEHEARVYGSGRLAWVGGSALGYFIGALRFLIAVSMCGLVDSYHVDGEVVAWSHSICKGDTIRGMWFYQNRRASQGRMCIWFHTLATTVKRAIEMRKKGLPVTWVDAGPSGNKAISKLKARYGLESTTEWCEQCGYNTGPFRVVPFLPIAVTIPPPLDTPQRQAMRKRRGFI